MPWLCERCGHAGGANDPPCPQCGFDRQEQVREERVPEQVSPSALFVWRCPGCGQAHGRRHARCAECDRMGLVAAFLEDGEAVVDLDRPTTDSSASGPSTLSTVLDATAASTAWLVAFGLGLLTVIVGFLFLVGGAPTFGAPILLVGLFALPSVRERLGRVVGARPPGWLAAIVYVVGLVAAVVWYNV